MLSGCAQFMIIGMEAPGAKLKFIRETMGLTQDELASRMKPRPLTRQSVVILEKEGIKTFRVLKMVAAALGIHPETLIQKTGDAPFKKIKPRRGRPPGSGKKK